MSTDPNSFKELERPDVDPTNPEPKPEGTETTPDTTPGIDYEVKFKESQKEALRLLEENKKRDEMIASLQAQLEGQTPKPPSSTVINDPADTDTDLFPGFEELDPAAQQNLINYTNAVVRKAQQSIMSNPAIAYASQTYNEQKWNTAYAAVKAKFPDLSEHEDAFRAEFYKPHNVPDNIEELLEKGAKMFLYDKAKEIGAEEERRRLERFDHEDITGHDPNPAPNRTLEDWQRMARENPAEFARRSQEYNADLQAGRI